MNAHRTLTALGRIRNSHPVSCHIPMNLYPTASW